VLLQNGDLIQINDVKNIRSDVKKIIDLGEILIPYGEFIENNSLLPDSSYVYEWWIQDLQHALGCLPKTNTIDDISKGDITLQQMIDKQFNDLLISDIQPLRMHSHSQKNIQSITP